MFRKIKLAFYILKADGIKMLCQRAKDFVVFRSRNFTYKQWIQKSEKDILDVRKLQYNPLISIVVPVYNVKKEQLKECIESVLKQTVSNWELCLVDDCSTMPEVKETLKLYEKNKKIKIVYRKENGHICRASNNGIEVSTGEFIAFLDCDDVLAPNAIYEVTKILNENPQYDFIYSDEDLMTEDGRKRYAPRFKPDWSPDTLMSSMYTCHFAVYRKSITEEIGKLRVGFEGSQDYDFTLRFTEQTDNIGHIPKVLYHWRARKESSAKNPSVKSYAFKAMENAKKDALKRRGLEGKVLWKEKSLNYRVVYSDRKKPKISIIILLKNSYELLEQCVESIVKMTTYNNYEIIIIDNGSISDIKQKCEKLCARYSCEYLYEKEEFNFSKMCNKGAKYANGEYYLFLDDAMMVQEQKFLEIMEGHAALPHIGAVSAKILYPNTKEIWHVGIVNYNNGPSSCFAGYKDNNYYYDGRIMVDYNYIAVTGFCMMVSKEHFWKIGGFNESFYNNYGDVELCFRIVKAGYYNVVRNDVVFHFYEKSSQKQVNMDEKGQERKAQELKKLYELHPDFRGKDPFYSPNLNLDKNDFSLNI